MKNGKMWRNNRECRKRGPQNWVNKFGLKGKVDFG